MKSDLDARPVYCQKIDTIIGHFLICYITVLLERLFQLKELNDEYSSSEIFEFMRDYRVIEVAGGYFNTTTKSEFITQLSEKAALIGSRRLLFYSVNAIFESQIKKSGIISRIFAFCNGYSRDFQQICAIFYRFLLFNRLKPHNSNQYAPVFMN